MWCISLPRMHTALNSTRYHGPLGPLRSSPASKPLVSSPWKHFLQFHFKTQESHQQPALSVLTFLPGVILCPCIPNLILKPLNEYIASIWKSPEQGLVRWLSTRYFSQACRPETDSPDPRGGRHEPTQAALRPPHVCCGVCPCPMHTQMNAVRRKIHKQNKQVRTQKDLSLKQMNY